MAEYTQEQQTEIVYDAMILTATIEREKQELRNVLSEKFKSIPKEPERHVLARPEVEVKMPDAPKMKYKEFLTEKFRGAIIAGALFIIGTILCLGMGINDALTMGVGFVIFFFLPVSLFLYLRNKKTTEQKYLESDEYKNAVANAKQKAETEQQELDAQREQKQRELDAMYEEESQKYKNEIIPAYESEKSQWLEVHNKKLAFLENDIKYNTEALDNLYEITKKISAPYRELGLLKWLYNDMSTSDHDIVYATELLDRDRQRAATENVGTKVTGALRDLETTIHNDLNYVYDAIQSNTNALDSINDEIDKMRKQNNLGNIAAVYQRWGIKKQLKGMQ